MKILFIHNFHQSTAPSGDDVVVKNEIELLKKNGHEVFLFAKSNEEFYRQPLVKKLPLYFEIPWSKRIQMELKKVLSRYKPDVVHIHNVFPQISLSIYKILKEIEIPFVHTLHDYRLFCANAFLLRNGKVCHMCPEKSPIYSLRYRCFRGSLVKTLPVFLFLEVIKKRNLLHYPDKFIALTDFAKQMYIRFGIQANKIAVKPNFINMKNDKPKYDKDDYVIFVGRFSEEKGLDILLESFNNPKLSKVKLKVVGSGPIEDEIKKRVSKHSNIELIGFVEHTKAIQLIGEAKFLILPSIWYESFPMTIVEAFSVGTPVIASYIGAMSVLISPYKNGLLFSPGDVTDLSGKIRELWNNEPLRKKLSKGAYLEYLTKYTPQKNYKMLIEIYNEVINSH